MLQLSKFETQTILSNLLFLWHFSLFLWRSILILWHVMNIWWVSLQFYPRFSSFSQLSAPFSERFDDLQGLAAARMPGGGVTTSVYKVYTYILYIYMCIYCRLGCQLMRAIIEKALRRIGYRNMWQKTVEARNPRWLALAASCQLIGICIGASICFLDSCNW